MHREGKYKEKKKSNIKDKYKIKSYGFSSSHVEML